MLTAGLKHTVSLTVTPHLTAKAVSSGSLEVYATPMMIAAMENCCLLCVAPYLEKGMATVGTMVNVTHDAASPVGAQVTVECTLLEVDRRRLVFDVIAKCGEQVLGKGTHERFIINEEKFIAKLK